MSAAAFVLAINLCIAGIFTTAFSIAAAYQRPALAARWLALGFAIGMISAVLEFTLPFQQDHRLVSLAIPASFVCATAACIVGLAHHYQLKRPWPLLAFVVVLTLTLNIYILDMPRDTLLRGILYQAPYAAVQAVGVFVLLGKKHWSGLDRALLASFALSALHFLGKPALSAAISSGAVPQDYLGSTYAAISQSLGAIIIICNGLLMLLVIVRDILIKTTNDDEADPLSGLFARRKFEDLSRKALDLAAQGGIPAIMIIANIDNLRAANAEFGTGAGDMIIQAFARIMRDTTEPQSIIGRVDGDEFAIFTPGASLMTGRLDTETMRNILANLPQTETGAATPVTASFGIASLWPGDSLPQLMRRAESALVKAKSEGKNRVALFREDPAAS